MDAKIVNRDFVILIENSILKNWMNFLIKSSKTKWNDQFDVNNYICEVKTNI